MTKACLATVLLFVLMAGLLAAEEAVAVNSTGMRLVRIRPGLSSSSFGGIGPAFVGTRPGSMRPWVVSPGTRRSASAHG